MIPAGLTSFQRRFEIAPILLVGGSAANVPGGAMTILTLTEGGEVTYPDPDQYFAHFKPMPGSTLEDWGIAEYPFANMVMAANAVIQNPLRFSLLMECPAKSNDPNNNYSLKQARITSMKTRLDAHILAGGYFTVATPAYTYANCLLVALKDVSSGGDKQVQMAYQWDFVQPLITQQAATQTYNNSYNKLNGGLPTTSPLTNSGANAAFGQGGGQAPAPGPVPTVTP